MSDLSVTISIPIQNCYDVLTTAAEGGSNYWLFGDDAEDFLDQDVKRNDQHDVVLIAFNAKDGKHFTISPAEIAIAFTKVIRCEVSVRSDLRTMIASLACGDACDIDAEGADVLVQVAAFGEVVYG